MDLGDSAAADKERLKNWCHRHRCPFTRAGDTDEMSCAACDGEDYEAWRAGHEY